MKSLICKLLFLLLLTGCKTDKKQSVKSIDKSNVEIEKKEESTIPTNQQTTQNQWKTVNEKGFYVTNFVGTRGGEEYDESFKPLKQSELAYELTPLSIVAITTDKKPKDDFDKQNQCRWANFVKINHNGKERIVFGAHVYVPVKKHKAENVSLWVVKNYQTGVANEDGLTGCDEQHPLLLIDEKGNAHTIQEDEEEVEEQMYISLAESDVAGDKIQSISQKKGVLNIDVLRTLQEGAERYTMKIFQRDEIWWAETSELKKATDERLTTEAKSIKELEDIALDKHLKAWSKGDKADTELVGEYIDYMKELIKTHPKSMQYPFRILVGDGALETVTSEDKKLRFYSFNTEMGGTMQFFDTLYQTNENDTVKTTDVDEGEGSNGYYVSDIYTFNNGKETYYVVIANAIASSRDIAQIAKAYTIHNGKLEPVKLFTTEKKAYQEIPVKYNFFSAMDKHNERPIRVIRYDYDKKEFHIALVDNDGKVGDKNLIYQWNGNRFKYTGIK